MGYGNSLHEAKNSFELALAEIVTYTRENAVLLPELERLGWNIERKQNVINLDPPSIECIYKRNQEFRKIISSESFYQGNMEVELELAG